MYEIMPCNGQQWQRVLIKKFNIKDVKQKRSVQLTLARFHLAKMAIVAHCLKIGMKTNYYHLVKPMTIMMNECVSPFSALPSEVIA